MDREADHGGASGPGQPTWTLVLRGLPGRQGLLHRVSPNRRVLFRMRRRFEENEYLKAFQWSNRCFPSVSPRPVCVCVSARPRSDDTQTTTWLHPRSGDPVNSGHMIRSGTFDLFTWWRRSGPAELLWTGVRFCCRPAPRLGGGLHGRGGQLLHQVSPPGCCVQGTGPPGRARFWAKVLSHVRLIVLQELFD